MPFYHSITKEGLPTQEFYNELFSTETGGPYVLLQLFRKSQCGSTFIPISRATQIEHEEETTVGKVVWIGKECWLASHLFPLGPRCSLGDYVVFSLVGSRPQIIDGVDCTYRWIHDDRVMCVVKKPELLIRG